MWDRDRIENAWKKVVIEPESDGPYCLLAERRHKPRSGIRFEDRVPTLPVWLDIPEVLYGCR